MSEHSDDEQRPERCDDLESTHPIPAQRDAQRRLAGTPMEEQMDEPHIYAAKRVARERERDSFAFVFLCVNAGLILTALGVDLFKAPNHFALGGTSGLSIILATLFPTLDVGAFMWILNGVLVALGLVFLGRKTMGWTIFASFALSFYVSLFEWVWPVVDPLTSNKLLELCFAVLLPALGSALVFNVGASTGGTDILAMILKKYTTLQIGKALFVVDGLIVVWSVFLYGAETGLLCILGLLAKTMVVDGAIESVNQSKVCTLICSDPGAVERYLVEEMRRTATLTRVEGGFSGKTYTQVMCVLSRTEAVRLRNWVRQTQPSAFMTIVTTSDIVGRGFRGAN